MAEIDVNEIGEALRKARLVRLVTSGSVLLAILYVLSFIYVKTYLGVFGFQVELTSLSVIDLLLAHRYFVGQHFFVLAGALQAHLLYEFRWTGVREQKLASFFALVAPLLVLGAAYGLSIWSERHIPKGFNIAAPGLPLAFTAGWISGGVAYWLFRKAARKPTAIRDATWIVAAAIALYVAVSTYRLFSLAVAEDRQRRTDFQVLQLIETEGDTFVGPCLLIHIDSKALYLSCGQELRVVTRDKLRSFRVAPSR